MSINKNQILGPLNKLKREDLELLHKKTVMAILIIAIAYILGIIFFTVLFLLKIKYFYIALLFPLFGYLWLISFGAKYVNNHYGLKKINDCTVVYKKKRQNYSTLVAVHFIIFLISTIVRFIYEINNLFLIKQELNKEKNL